MRYSHEFGLSFLQIIVKDNMNLHQGSTTRDDTNSTCSHLSRQSFVSYLRNRVQRLKRIITRTQPTPPHAHSKPRASAKAHYRSQSQSQCQLSLTKYVSQPQCPHRISSLSNGSSRSQILHSLKYKDNEPEPTTDQEPEPDKCDQVWLPCLLLKRVRGSDRIGKAIPEFWS
ncbi:hypothetical protein F2P79_018502 [Pimephales promelas]|nr:hypothetical protein F2P79_018502 [Pimephales promelas]